MAQSDWQHDAFAGTGPFEEAGPFEDLRSAFDQEAGTRRQVISARHSFVDALLSLEEAVGTRIGHGRRVSAIE